jgi:RNA-directed DNA polymerase
VWALDADLAAAFDRIDHFQLLEALGSFPARDTIRAWLTAGVIETGKGFTPTEEGTPQGGVISPLLVNVALHGLEQAAGVRYITSGRQAGDTMAGSPVVIRYADDMIALCHTRQQAEQVKAKLAEWLALRGLVFNDDKTRIVTLSAGFDFLGFNVRRYGPTLLIKPSTAAVQRIRERLKTEMRALRGSNAAAVLAALTPIIRGWAAYYRGVVSSRTFKALDSYMWTLIYKWATYGHANKSRTWVVARYFGKYNKFRNDHWVFGDATSGAYLVKFAWTPIVRHTLVKGGASPDDPALTEYWATRRRRIKPPLDGYTLRLLTKQDGRCPLCGAELLSAEQPPQSPLEWERWWLHVTRRAIVADYLVHHGRPGSPDGYHTRLVHAACQHGRHARHRTGTALQPEPPSRLA